MPLTELGNPMFNVEFAPVIAEEVFNLGEVQQGGTNWTKIGLIIGSLLFLALFIWLIVSTILKAIAHSTKPINQSEKSSFFLGSN